MLTQSLVQPKRNYVDLSEALRLIHEGKRMARYGWKNHNLKWIELRPETPTEMSDMVFYYPPSPRYPNGKHTFWSISRCDRMEKDWYEVTDEEITFFTARSREYQRLKELSELVG